MRYDIDGILDGDEHVVKECISYEEFISAICDTIADGYGGDLILKRRCCGSVWKRVLTPEDARDLIGAVQMNRDDSRKLLFDAVEGWYMRGGQSCPLD